MRIYCHISCHACCRRPGGAVGGHLLRNHVEAEACELGSKRSWQAHAPERALLLE